MKLAPYSGLERYELVAELQKVKKRNRELRAAVAELLPHAEAEIMQFEGQAAFLLLARARALLPKPRKA